LVVGCARPGDHKNENKDHLNPMGSVTRKLAGDWPVHKGEVTGLFS
jgi:hypothetical protein